MKQKTWLPVFTGFYHSIFDVSDHYVSLETELSESEYKDIYSELSSQGIDQEYFNEHFWEYINFSSGNSGVAEAVTYAILELEHCGIINDVELEEVVSPRYYNFSTDSINCIIDYDQKKLLKYLKDNIDDFKKYIKERYTSRDGFISSYPNDVDYWLDTENWDDHEVGSLLDFVLQRENKDAEYDLCEAANCLEAFMNSVEVDLDRMIENFKKSKKGASDEKTS